MKKVEQPNEFYVYIRGGFAGDLAKDICQQVLARRLIDREEIKSFTEKILKTKLPAVSPINQKIIDYVLEVCI